MWESEWQIEGSHVSTVERSINALFSKPDKRMAGLMKKTPKRAPLPLGEYCVRYAGVVRNSQRLIIGKGCPKSSTTGQLILRSQNSSIIVFGGGYGYFTVVYDADESRLVELTYNSPI